MILNDKRVWVTGVTGTIGGAIAARFKEEGATVFSDRVDLKDLYAIDRYAEVSRPDILVNCAGVYPHGGILGVCVYGWAKALDVNLFGAVYITRSVLMNMKDKGGKIIHMSGGGAAYGRPFYSAYAASKAGLVRFIECVAEEVKALPFNIQINAIAPGSVKSKMNPEGTETPDKAVELALYLASQESNHITGRLIHVNEDYRKPMTEEGGKLRRIPL